MGKVHQAATDLRKERIRLIKIKAKEITGEDIEIDVGEIDTDVIVDVNINELARTEGIDPNMLATLTAKELEMLRTISQDDLAPPPSQEDIFGQIDAVKKQFEEDHELIARQFEENKVTFIYTFKSRFESLSSD